MHINEELGAVKEPCATCSGSGWREPIGPHPDGSYITSRPCQICDAQGFTWRWPPLNPEAA